MKQPLIILAGPTAAGKTKLSVELAGEIGGEIISADSMQVYRYMDIGSAKISRAEMKGIPHYLVDVLEPDEEFHVVRFQEMAKEAMAKIYARGHIPILVGGTGFYIQALLYDISFASEDGDARYRQELEHLVREQGADRLHARLRRVDPQSAEIIHANNVKRVIRALEYYHLTGEPISEHNQRERAKQSPYEYRYFVLTDERRRLYERIDRRVDQMMEAGLLEEVRGLRKRGYTRDLVSMQGLGYKELLAFLDGEISLEEAVYRIKRDTRHFAKRQITWFKREKDAIWISREEYGSDQALLKAVADQIPLHQAAAETYRQTKQRNS